MADNFAYTHDASSPPEFLVGNKVNWGDTIWQISPDDTPFLSTIGRDTSHNSAEAKWFQDKLESRDSSNSTAKVQGSSPSKSTKPRYECYNYNMIMSDSAFISRSQEDQNKAGVDSELNKQLVDKMVTLKQSVQQAILTRVKKRKPSENSTAGLAAGIPGLTGLYGDQTMHINGSSAKYGTDNTTNVQIGEDSFDAGSSATGYAKFKESLKAVWNLGAKPTKCWCSAKNKEFISDTWDNPNVDRTTTEEEKVKELVNVVITDFGTVQFVPLRDFQSYADSGSDDYDGESGNTQITDFAILADPKYLELLLYQDFMTQDLPTEKDGYLRRALVEFSFAENAPSGVVVFDFAGNSTHTTTKGLPTSAASYTL